jgi:preprotein translocase subunit SecB
VEVNVAKTPEIPFIHQMVSGLARCAQFDQLSLQNLRYLLLMYGQMFEKKHY